MKYCPKCRTEYQDWTTRCADCKVALVNELPKDNTRKKEKQQEIRLCHSCGYPIAVSEAVCKNCGAQTGPYDTLDPLKHISERGRVYRKMTSGDYDKRQVTPYMSIIVGLILFVMPAVFLAFASISLISKATYPIALLTGGLAGIFGLVGVKSIIAAARKIRTK